jgi:hypothetical protein
VAVTVLHVDDCPNTSALLDLLDVVLEKGSVEVRTRTVSSLAEAEALGMHGSPTLVIDGRDPFVGSPEATLSCRLYQTEDGLRGIPSIAQLREALTNMNVRTRREARS